MSEGLRTWLGPPHHTSTCDRNGWAPGQVGRGAGVCLQGAPPPPPGLSEQLLVFFVCLPSFQKNRMSRTALCACTFAPVTVIAVLLVNICSITCKVLAQCSEPGGC